MNFKSLKESDESPIVCSWWPDSSCLMPCSFNWVLHQNFHSFVTSFSTYSFNQFSSFNSLKEFFHELFLPFIHSLFSHSYDVSSLVHILNTSNKIKNIIFSNIKQSKPHSFISSSLVTDEYWKVYFYQGFISSFCT